jgi:hypothetical protein
LRQPNTNRNADDHGYNHSYTDGNRYCDTDTNTHRHFYSNIHSDCYGKDYTHFKSKRNADCYIDGNINPQQHSARHSYVQAWFNCKTAANCSSAPYTGTATCLTTAYSGITTHAAAASDSGADSLFTTSYSRAAAQSLAPRL